MKRLIPISLILLAATLAGCSNMPSYYKGNPSRIANASHWDLCHAYWQEKVPAIKAELEQRGMLDAREWDLIERGKISKDISQLAVVCAWGKPHHKNTYSTTYLAEQWVYQMNYVYFGSDGYVTGWSTQGR